MPMMSPTPTKIGMTMWPRERGAGSGFIGWVTGDKRVNLFRTFMVAISAAMMM
jgi:hypothetical protein